MKNKVLVTGGAGYIGSHMVYLLLKDGFDVVVWDDFSTGYRGALEALSGMELSGRLSFEEIDLLDKGRVISEFPSDVDCVFHFAAKCSVDESMSDPDIYFENNVQGTVNLLRAMKKNACEKIVFSSTCAVYGSGQYFPVDERHPTNPENPYGESKLMAEKVIQWDGKLFGINYAILRYFNVCGAQEEGGIGDSKKPSSLLVQNAVRGALKIDDFYLTCPKVDTPDGTPIRDYVDVLDLCAAHLKAYEWMGKSKENSGVFNLGNGRGTSVKEVIGAVKSYLNVDFEIKDSSEKKRRGEYAKVFADNRKAVEVLGWEPVRGIEDSVESLAKWYGRRPEGWEG